MNTKIEKQAPYDSNKFENMQKNIKILAHN